MPPEDVKDIQQRLHDLNADEAKLLADVQVSLTGIERIHAQRRIAELTLVELQRKAEEDNREKADRNPQGKQGKKGKGKGGNNKRRAEEQHKQQGSSKRQRQAGPNDTHGAQAEGLPGPIPGPFNDATPQNQNQPMPDGECKCLRVDVHCGSNKAACRVCKALGCAGAQSGRRRRRKNNGHQNNVTVAAEIDVVPTTLLWPQDTANIINIDAMDTQG